MLCCEASTCILSWQMFSFVILKPRPYSYPYASCFIYRKFKVSHLAKPAGEISNAQWHGVIVCKRDQSGNRSRH